MQHKRRIPVVYWRLLGCFLGSVMTFLCILFSLAIWISYFDNDGGEPGATTIFGSIPMWPLFGLSIIAVGIACAFSRWTFGVVFAVTLSLFIWSFVLIKDARAENQKKQEQRLNQPSQELVVASPVGVAHNARY